MGELGKTGYDQVWYIPERNPDMETYSNGFLPSAVADPADRYRCQPEPEAEHRLLGKRGDFVLV